MSRPVDPRSPLLARSAAKGAITTFADTETASDRLRMAREHRGWTQEQLAKKAKVDHQTVWRHENRGGMSARAVAAYAKVLRVSEEYIRYGIGPAPGEHVNEIVDKYLRTPFGKTTPKWLVPMLRRVSYASLGVRHPDAEAIHRVRQLIEMNRHLAPTMGDAKPAPEPKSQSARR